MVLLGSVTAFAQSKISGTVVDSKGEPIYGATVIVTGTTNGTITDFDGNFTINTSAGTPLTISFLGYETANVNAAAGMKVTLEDESQQVEEVQVVAYGAQKKVTVTGAISSVKSEDLVRTPVSSVNNVLAGQLSGVTTVQYSGEPGADAAQIFVRGKASFAGDDAVKPLLQIDGVVRDDLSDMSTIDANDIESITILKDASATAVFGVRGANGVILITTKRGSEGKANINVSTSFSALSPTKMVPMAGSYDYATFYNKAIKNDNPENTEKFKPGVIQKFKDGSDPIRFPSVDWIDYILKDFTMQTQSNLSISGGNDKVRYFVSSGMYTQGGLFKEFDRNYHFDYRYKRFNYRSNIDINVTKTTTLAISVSGEAGRTLQPITGGGSAAMFKDMYAATPFNSPGFVDGKLIQSSLSPADNADGNVLPFLGAGAMTYLTYHPGYYKNDNNKIGMNMNVTQKLDMITKGLVFNIKGAYNSLFTSRKTFDGGGIATWTPLVDENGGMKFRKNGEDLAPVANGSAALGKGRDWYFETALNWNRTFEAHSLKALVLYNQSKRYYLGSYSDIPRTYVGLVARVSYDYANRYMAEFNYGHNGSENFAPENRYGSFPAGSIGWNISEEGFMENLKPTVSFLKVRASWGLVGNDQVGGNRFMYTPDPYQVKNGAVFDHAGSGYIFGAHSTYTEASASFYHGTNPSQSMLNNAKVSWEKAFKQDYGLDVNFLDNRLSCTFDYYYEKRRDILWQDNTAPSMLGFAQPYTNFGRVNNWGWEASAGWNSKINDDWRVWAKFNISYNQNEIVEDRQTPQMWVYQYTKGHRIGARNQFKFWRFYDEQAAELYQKQFGRPLPEQTYLKSGIRPGDAIYVDLNEDGVVDDNDYSRDFGFTDDPEFTAGLNLGFAWKNLTFSTQLTGAWNVSRMIEGTFRRPFYNSADDDMGGLLQYHVDNTWDPEHPSQSAKYPRATFDHKTQNYANSTLYEQDSKYLRIKTAEIAYNFNFPWMKTIGLKKFQMALNGYNLLTFTPYLWGDPESRASAQPTYPLQRTYTASLKLNF